jgi:hypothetical protein
VVSDERRQPAEPIGSIAVFAFALSVLLIAADPAALAAVCCPGALT